MKWSLTSFDWIGIIGILIYGLLFIYTISRLYESWTIKNSTLKYFNYKISFHLVFAVYCICETTYYASILLEGQLSVWGYSFHAVSLFLNVVFFSMVVNLWGYTLDYSDSYSNFSILSGLMNFINLIATSLDLVYLGLSDGYEDFASHDLLSVTTISMHVLSLLVFTIILLIYGLHIKNKLSQSYGRQTMAQHDLNRKLAIILRVNSVLNVCCLCYLIRVILLCWVIYDTIQYEADSGGVTGHIPLILWFFLTGWIPTVGPSVIFLYIMKTTTVTRSRPENTTFTTAAGGGVVGTNNGTHSTHPSQHEDSSRYSWYYDENVGELSQERAISISRFASVEVESSNPISFKYDPREHSDVF